MSISTAESRPLARSVAASNEGLTVELADGRRISVPLAWFPRLLSASPEQRDDWEILGNGEGIHCPSVDEDLSVAGLLRGSRAPKTET